MQLTLERKRYSKIDPASLRLTDRRCGPTFYNDTLMVIRAPLGSCGTVSGRRGILLEFSNEVYAELIGRSAISREPAYQFRLRCRYYTTAKIVLHPFRPIEKIVIDPPPGKFGYNNSGSHKYGKQIRAQNLIRWSTWKVQLRTTFWIWNGSPVLPSQFNLKFRCWNGFDSDDELFMCRS